MIVSAPLAPVLSIGQIAASWGVAAWKVRRLYERGILPPAARVGAYRVVPITDLPKIKAALREVGYLPAKGETMGTDRALSICKVTQEHQCRELATRGMVISR